MLTSAESMCLLEEKEAQKKRQAEEKEERKLEIEEKRKKKVLGWMSKYIIMVCMYILNPCRATHAGDQGRRKVWLHAHMV